MRFDLTVNQFVSGMDDILEANYRNSSSVDSPLTKVSRSQYQAFSNKTDTGTPTSYFVECSHLLTIFQCGEFKDEFQGIWTLYRR